MKRHLAGLVALTGALATSASAQWADSGYDLNTPRAGCAIVVDPAGKLYAIGGRLSWTPDPVNGTATNTVEVLDPKAPNPQWTVMPQAMITRREFFAAVCVGRFLYVFGGSNSFVSGTVYYDLAERLDLLDPNATWVAINPIPTERNIAGAVADRYGRIYVIGGSNGTNVALNTVERYDPLRGGWDTPPPLTYERGRPGVAMDIKGRIYAIGGGINEGEVLKVERLDPADASPDWLDVADLPNIKKDLQQGCTASTGADGRIYVEGSGITFRYDADQDAWESWEPLPAAIDDQYGIDSQCAVTDDNGRIWLAGAYESTFPIANVFVLDGPCGAAGAVRWLRDSDADASIGIVDLLKLLSDWGICP